MSRLAVDGEYDDYSVIRDEECDDFEEDIETRNEIRDTQNKLFCYYNGYLHKPDKILLTCRFDLDIIEWFKAKGKGYQTHINYALRSMIDIERENTTLENMFCTYTEYLQDNFDFEQKPKCIKKISLSIRYDEDIVNWFKSKGKGYQTYMNDALRVFMEAEQASE